MTPAARHPFLLMAILLIAIGGTLPVAAYLATLGREPMVTPEQAKGILARPETDAVLVDVRSAQEYAAEHIEVAKNWPYEQIKRLTSTDSIPGEFRGKHLLLLCDSGILSGLAARHLQSLGVARVFHVQGGMQTWVAAAGSSSGTVFNRLRTQTGETRDLPFHDSPLLEQWMAVLTGFVVKPFYTFVALILVILLWRRRAPEMVALKWAMLCFFVGENFCAANYLVCGDRCILYEYLHSFGMTLCFGLTTYALMEGSDRYLIKHGDPRARCAGLSLCLRCIKRTDVPCGFQRLFLFVIPAVMLVALMPLRTALLPAAYNTRIWGTLYTCSHPVIYQMFEERYLPVVAVALLAVSWMALRFKRNDAVPWAKIFFAAGVAALGFSFLRLVLFHCYRDNLVWFAAWEEITELLFILGVTFVLWLFREAFILAESSHRAETSLHPHAGATDDASPQL